MTSASSSSAAYNSMMMHHEQHDTISEHAKRIQRRKQLRQKQAQLRAQMEDLYRQEQDLNQELLEPDEQVQQQQVQAPPPPHRAILRYDPDATESHRGGEGDYGEEDDHFEENDEDDNGLYTVTNHSTRKADRSTASSSASVSSSHPNSQSASSFAGDTANSVRSFPTAAKPLKGPIRFEGLTAPLPFEERLVTLTYEQSDCLRKLQAAWDDRHPRHGLPDYMVLQFGMFSPGKKRFNYHSALSVMKRFDYGFLDLNIHSMKVQLATKTLFPIPQLLSADGHDCFYMRPSRYFPKQTPTSVIIDNLCYVMNGMVRASETAATQGVAFIANMNDWTMKNFSVDYCLEFMNVLQGKTFPIKVNMFLIVNPPTWFNRIWKIMKAMLSRGFRKKVHMIKEEKLPKYLMPGYGPFLVNEFSLGRASTSQIVKDYIEYRKRTDLLNEEDMIF